MAPCNGASYFTLYNYALPIGFTHPAIVKLFQDDLGRLNRGVIVNMSLEARNILDCFGKIYHRDNTNNCQI